VPARLGRKGGKGGRKGRRERAADGRSALRACADPGLRIGLASIGAGAYLAPSEGLPCGTTAAGHAEPALLPAASCTCGGGRGCASCLGAADEALGAQREPRPWTSPEIRSSSKMGAAGFLLFSAPGAPQQAKAPAGRNWPEKAVRRDSCHDARGPGELLTKRVGHSENADGSVDTAALGGLAGRTPSPQTATRALQPSVAQSTLSSMGAVFSGRLGRGCRRGG